MLIQLYKNAYSGLSHKSWYLSMVMLVNRSGTMVVPFMTIYCVQRLHFTIEQAGIIMGLFGLGSITGSFLGGKFTDRFGFYDLQIFALLSGGLFFILLGYQKTFLGMGIGTFLLSLCNESFRPANSTAIAHYSTEENKTRSYSLNRLAINLGWAFGGAVGGFLASFNYHLLFWVDGSTNILAALLLLRLIPRVRFVKPVKKQAGQVVGLSPYKDYIYLLFVVLVVLYASCFFQLFTMQPVFYKTQWHLNERFIGFLMALNGILITVIEMVLIHNLQGRKHPLVYIVMGTLLLGSGFVVLNVFPAGAGSAIVVILLLTCGEMMSMPFMNSFWISRTSPDNRGGYAALYSMAWSAAQIWGPYTGSRIIQKAGFSALWWLLGIICAVAATGFTVLYRYNYSPVKIAKVQVN